MRLLISPVLRRRSVTQFGEAIPPNAITSQTWGADNEDVMHDLASLALLYQTVTRFREATPPYATISYTWGTDNERVILEDLMNSTGKAKPGYQKIRFCGEEARQDSLEYFWIDSCCIDKGNKAELSKAINSISHWYRNADRCYLYRSDVSTTKRNVSGQFTWELASSYRGWTLPELLAPHSVELFYQNVERLEAMSKLEYLLPVVSAREGSIGLRIESRLSEDMFVLGLDTKLQATKTEFDELFEAIRGRERRWTYEESIKDGQHVCELRQEEKQGLVYYGTIALGRNATKCDKIGANIGLGCQHIWIDALCIIQNDRTDSAKQPKLLAQYYQNAVCTLDRLSLGIEKSCLRNNLRCLVIHGTADYRVSKSLIVNFEKLGSGGESVAVQDPSAINIQGSPANNMQFSSGAEEQCVGDSNVTCSTALSDKTSVFSNPSENDAAAGTEISNHYNSSTSTSQSWQEVPLLRMGQILPANAHESCEPELQVNGAVTPGFEYSHQITDGRDDSGNDDHELPTLGKDTAHSEEAILANYETSALRDFMDDPGHQYWTWCKEHQNWWHKDERTSAMIWAPLDFD
jgi:hypothetical protein